MKEFYSFIIKKVCFLWLRYGTSKVTKCNFHVDGRLYSFNLQPTNRIVSHDALNAMADSCKSSLNSRIRKTMAKPFDRISPSAK
jgi:hypothetical protein